MNHKTVEVNKDLLDITAVSAVDRMKYWNDFRSDRPLKDLSREDLERVFKELAQKGREDAENQIREIARLGGRDFRKKIYDKPFPCYVDDHRIPNHTYPSLAEIDDKVNELIDEGRLWAATAVMSQAKQIKNGVEKHKPSIVYLLKNDF